MNYAKKILYCGMVAGLWCGLSARPSRAQGPVISGIGPAIEGNLGFQYIGEQVPGQTTRVAMFGLNTGMTVGVSKRLGVRADFGYSRSGAIFGSGHHSDIMSYLAGPVFYPTLGRHMAPYVQFLMGGARVTGATPQANGDFVRGYSNKLAWAGGGGIEVRAWRNSALRVGADYLHTTYFDPNVAVTGQGNLRAVVSWTHYFSGGYGRR